MLAAKTLDIGKRLLLVSGNEAQRTAISKALWSDDPVSFLAHDHAGSEQEKDQPILIAEKFTTANGATFVILADGEWQDEALDYERAFYLFTAAQIEFARSAWRDLDARDGVTPRYWKQEGGRWVQGP